MFRTLTVAREYGSGAGAIARRVADQLGWNLLDEGLLWEIAWAARVDVETVRRYDERVDPWWHCFHRSGIRAVSLSSGVAIPDTDFFDAQLTAGLARSVITQAAAEGNCVIVGRGAECVLQDRKDVLHVFIYAPWEERVSRVISRLGPQVEIRRLLLSTDSERARYVRTYYRCDWKDPHLYQMMISSQMGSEAVASLIVDAVQRGGMRRRAREMPLL